MDNPKRTPGTGLHKTGFKKRPKSWEPIRRSDCHGRPQCKTKAVDERNQKSIERKQFDYREFSSWENTRCACASLFNPESWTSSGCGCGCNCCSWENDRKLQRSSSRLSPAKKCNPEFYKSALQKQDEFCSEIDFRRMKRSLKLLGFELSDFGIYCDGTHTTLRWRPKQQSPTFRTKVFDRSVASLESLREFIRRVWAQDQLDKSHLRLLAQAAYEEWYFRKEKAIWEKRAEEKFRRMMINGKLREDIQRKKEKSEEEFRKWLHRKKAKSKDKKKIPAKNESFRMSIESKEEVEQAFLRWKKAKDKELAKQRQEKKKEEEMKSAAERQEAEKKATAEKAFLQWKIKLKELEKQQEEKRRKMKEQQEKIRKKIKEKKESTISFQVWKETKDQQIKQKIKQLREADKAAREERLTQMKERMYEAEQAFEDWLEKVDLRRQKQFCSSNTYQKTLPWIPA